MRKHMQNCLVVVGLLLAIPTLATPTVTSATAKQRFPWNGLVDITCSVSGFDGTSGAREFSVAAVMPDSGNVRYVSHVWVVRNGTNTTDLTIHSDGDHHLVWDASADLGEVRFTNMVVRVSLRTKVQLWEGGPYWATTNIGAEEPWEYGYYFWWGDTIGYRREGNAWAASDGSVQNFSFSSGNTSTYGKSIQTLRGEGWTMAGHVLAPEHDAAHVHWGGNWRIPTEDELSALVNNCDWTWTTQNGVNGSVVRGRGDYASASIFLPAAGYGNGTSLNDASSGGYFWSSVPYSDDYFSYYLDFDSGYHSTYNHNPYYGRWRYGGQSVRPVQGFTE